MRPDFRNRLARGHWTLERFGLTPSKLRHRFISSKRVDSLNGILCVSMPKAGTHLLERALCLHPALYRKLVGTIDEANLRGENRLARYLEDLRPGAILVSHLFHTPQRQRLIHDHNVRCLFLTRNPRDIVVSEANYLLGKRDHVYHSAFEGLQDPKDRLRMAILGNERSGLPSIRNLLEGFAGWFDSGALHVRFEDLIGSAGGGSDRLRQQCLSRIYEYLGIDAGDTDLARIGNRVYSNLSPTFHRAEIGSSRRLFDAEVDALFDSETAHIRRLYEQANAGTDDD